MTCILGYVTLTLMLGCALGGAYQLASAWLLRRFLRRPAGSVAAWPAVTVLKPVYGADPGLYDNLRSFCEQDYPAPVQVIIGAHMEADPAVAIARRLKRDLPQADIAIVVDETLAGSNRKVSNLINMMALARHPVLVMADSDMRAGPLYLRSVASALAQDGVGVVTSLYRGLPAGPALPSGLACAFINHGFLPSVLVAQALGNHSGCFGAGIALRRQVLEAAGGLQPLADELADDYMLGELVRRQGLAIAVSSELVSNMVAEDSLGSLARHELRWQRTIRAIAPLGLAASVVTNPVALALLGLAASGFGAAGWAVLAAALALRILVVRAQARLLGVPALAPWLVPVREVLSLAVLVASFCGQGVTWRGRHFRIGPGGKLRPAA